MKKHRLHDIVLGMVIMALVMGLAVPAFAANDEADQAAQALYELGLFSGTGLNADGTPNFDLKRSPTRQEAITMLVRLLGKEKEAQAGTWETPFTDVDGWAKPYVGYAYTNHLTGGTSPTTFSGNDTITVSQYITFILRALGYADGADFQWDKAWELSDKIGLTSGEYNSSTVSFLRGDVANISCTALTVCLKDSDKKLSDKLIDEEVFTREAYTKLEGWVTMPKAQTGEKDWVGVRDMKEAIGSYTTTTGAKDLPHIAAAIKETDATVENYNGYLSLRPADVGNGTSGRIYLETHNVDDRNEIWITGLNEYFMCAYKNPDGDYLKLVNAMLEDLISDNKDVESVMDMVKQMDANYQLQGNVKADMSDRLAAVDSTDKIIGNVHEFNTVVVQWGGFSGSIIGTMRIYNR